MLLKNKMLYIIITLICVVIFIFPTTIFASDSVYVWSAESKPLTNETSTNINDNSNNNTTNSQTITDNNTTILTSSTSTNSLALQSGSAILIEQHSR